MALDIQAGDNSTRDLVCTAGALPPKSQLKTSLAMCCFTSARLPEGADIKAYVQCMGEH